MKEPNFAAWLLSRSCHENDKEEDLVLKFYFETRKYYQADETKYLKPTPTKLNKNIDRKLRSL